MVKFKHIDYLEYNQKTVESLNHNDYDVIVIFNRYQNEFKVIKNKVMNFDPNVKINLDTISDYILECNNINNDVSDLNFHEAKLL